MNDPSNNPAAATAHVCGADNIPRYNDPGYVYWGTKYFVPDVVGAATVIVILDV